MIRRFRLPTGLSSPSNYNKRLKKSWVFLKHDNRCVWCNGVFSYDDLTLEHLLPRSRSGRNSESNLAAACRHCNEKRGNE